MSEEMFEVVNDRDEVYDCQPRRVVHRRGLKHRAVHILVFNARGQVFLQKRSMAKDSAPGQWDSSASGHVGVGESYDAAAQRELEEELGLARPMPPQRLFKLAAGPETGQEFVWVYRDSANGPFALDPEEIDDGRWLHPGEVDAWVRREPEAFAPSFLHIWAVFQRQASA